MLNILGIGVSGPVVEKNGLAIKTLDLTPLDLEHLYDLSNYKEIPFPPPRNCEIPDPKYYIDDQPFIPGINPWRELYLLQKCVDVPGMVRYVKHEIIEDKLLIYTYIAGHQTLEEWLDSPDFNQFRLTKILNLIYNIAEELEQQGIVHMDLKPKNVVLNKEFKPTVVDLGWSMFEGFPMNQEENEYFLQNLGKDIFNIKLFIRSKKKYLF